MLNRERKKICLITPNHISTNPRLVKEAVALEDNDFDVHLIFTQSDQFETDLDQAILAQHPNWTYDSLDWSGKGLRSKIFRSIFGLTKKLAEISFFLTPVKKFAPFIVNRNFFWQLQKAISAKADLYIGHNLGALPVARAAAIKTHTKFGFDAEDFHRNELTDDINSKDILLKAMVEEKNIPGVHHFTAASPLIAQAYQRIFPDLRPSVILNVFPKTDLPVMKNYTGKNLRLFWFSQTLGENRGIENIIKAIGQSRKGRYEFHLLGNPIQGYKQELEEVAVLSGLKNQLFFYDPVPEKEIFLLASTCDIGMASETGVPYNRDICLTNKIFTYIQAGLVVVASDTTAQKEFINAYPSIGKIYEKRSIESLTAVLDWYAGNKLEMEICKRMNYELGRATMNWEAEQEKYLKSIFALYKLPLLG